MVVILKGVAIGRGQCPSTLPNAISVKEMYNILHPTQQRASKDLYWKKFWNSRDPSAKTSSYGSSNRTVCPATNCSSPAKELIAQLARFGTMPQSLCYMPLGTARDAWKFGSGLPEVVVILYTFSAS